MFEYRHALLHLQLIAGIGPATIEKLVQQLTISQLAQMYAYTSADFVRVCSLSNDKAALLVKGLADKDLLEQELALIERYGITWTTIFDDNYPALLKTIYLPPVILYWKGADPANFAVTLAVVGARAATKYADICARLLLTDALRENVCIVSGGALGADTYAHELAVSAGHPTVAVIGSGLLRPYPAQNKNLFTRIIQNGGTVLSSFPLTTAPHAANFPARNRIIAGLSRGCLVLQAAVKSGALITARYALEQGREVGVVPGSLEEPLSAGCHLLLSQGAHCITQPREVIEILCQLSKRAELVASADQPLKLEKTAQDPLVLFCKEPRSFDEIVAQFKYEPSELHDLLFNLQLSGAITQNIIGLWCS